jgi:hypothetical protein
MHEPELFETYYEINKPHTSPMMWKIVGTTLAIHFVAFITLSQVNLLQTKACDSPYVNKVCEVLDAAYLGSVFLGTERSSVSSPYEKTELEDADITFVDVSDLDKFKYPEGYFEPEITEVDNSVMPIDANGIPLPTSVNGFPGIPNSANSTFNPTLNPVLPKSGNIGRNKGGFGNNGFGKGAVLPTPNPKAITGTIPDSPFSVSGENPTIGRNDKPKVISTAPTPKNPTLSNKSPDLPKLKGDENAAVNGKPKVDKTPTPNTNSNPVAEVDINKKPLTDLAEMVFAKLTAKEVDLTQPFTVVMDGTLTREGRFDATKDPKTKQSKSKFIKAEGDAKTVEVVQQAIEALGDSGWLGYLRNLGVEKVNFTLIQDNDNLRAVITSDLPNPDKANTVSSGFRGLVQTALLLDKTGAKKLGEDEKTLLNSAKVTSEGKNFILNVVIPKDAAQALIQKKLQENEAKAKATTTPQSNSVADGKNANVNTVK